MKSKAFVPILFCLVTIGLLLFGCTTTQSANGTPGSQGLKGDTGLQGPIGPQGVAGISGYEVIITPKVVSFNGSGAGFADAECPKGKNIISGSCTIDPSYAPQFTPFDFPIMGDYMKDGDSFNSKSLVQGWVCTITKKSSSDYVNTTVKLVSTAICANVQ